MRYSKKYLHKVYHTRTHTLSQQVSAAGAILENTHVNQFSAKYNTATCETPPVAKVRFLPAQLCAYATHRVHLPISQRAVVDNSGRQTCSK